MLTDEQISIAYQLFLGRTPENSDVVSNIKINIDSLSLLRNEFIKSSEFQNQMCELLKLNLNARLRHPFHLPYIPVDSITSDHELTELFNRTLEGWLNLGHNDPYWSTITQPQFRSDQIDKNKNEFYESGKWIVNLLLSALRRSNIDPKSFITCLEIGCGVGRVTNYLASEFKNLIATDISPGHIDIAKNYCNSNDNIEFILIKSLLDYQKLGNVDLVLSVITLQHNPPPVTNWIFKQLLTCLNPRGVAFIQIPTYRSGYMFDTKRYLSLERYQDLEMHFLPQSEIFKSIHELDCICLEVREDGMIGDESQMLSNTFLIQKI